MFSCQGFVGKTSTSVVKTTVKILMEESSSQVNKSCCWDDNNQLLKWIKLTAGVCTNCYWLTKVRLYKQNCSMFSINGPLIFYWGYCLIMCVTIITYFIWNPLSMLQKGWTADLVEMLHLKVLCVFILLLLSMQVVPESQVTLCETQKNTAPSVKVK